jgi:hypothetical protein
VTKLAVVGNSHVGAIEEAIGLFGAMGFPACDLCYVSNEWKITDFSENGCLESLLDAQTPNKQDTTIRLNDYDHILVCALGWWAPRNRFVYEDNPPTHPLGYMMCADWGCVAERVPATVQVTSSAVFEATVEAWVREHPVVRLARRLAGVFERDIFLQPWPAPSRAVKEDPAWFLNQWYEDRAAVAWSAFFNAQLRAVRNISADLRSNTILLDYPSSEVFDDGFMDQSLCQDDPFHANGTYGALVLKQVAATI